MEAKKRYKKKSLHKEKQPAFSRETQSGLFCTASPSISSLRSSDQQYLLVGCTDSVDTFFSLVYLLLFVVLESCRTRRTTWITKIFPWAHREQVQNFLASGSKGAGRLFLLSRCRCCWTSWHQVLEIKVQQIMGTWQACHAFHGWIHDAI